MFYSLFLSFHPPSSFFFLFLQFVVDEKGEKKVFYWQSIYPNLKLLHFCESAVNQKCLLKWLRLKKEEVTFLEK